MTANVSGLREVGGFNSTNLDMKNESSIQHKGLLEAGKPPISFSPCYVSVKILKLFVGGLFYV